MYSEITTPSNFYWFIGLHSAMGRTIFFKCKKNFMIVLLNLTKQINLEIFWLNSLTNLSFQLNRVGANLT